VAKDMAELRRALDQAIPLKALDRNLLIATWNLKSFGGLTEKWNSTEEDSPKRDLQSVLAIAEVISRFDVIALQEVKGTLKALRHMLRALGSDYSFILTDVTKGQKGNDERLAFLFDARKVRLSGLAAELVVPQEQMTARDIEGDALEKQFARTPYAVSFWSGGRTFILTTLHVLYGDNAKQRIPELKGIAQWLAEWAIQMSEWKHNLIALGDFNIDRKGDPLYNAFTSTGLTVPNDLHKVPRSIFDRPEDEKHKFYDQIAWFTGEHNVPALSLEYVQGCHFDFTAHALRSRSLTNQELQWRVSDHFPLWVEFSVR
jgi:endonuclease/exonuclease/phosphatase family metal-dependent hydrolase